MGLQLLQYVDLPPHTGPGGFDHAAICLARNLLYVAHTANDALDIINCATDRYVSSIPDLKEVAGALVSGDQVFASNRGENTVAIFEAGDEAKGTKVPVGERPNGLSFDPQRGLLLAANVGNPDIPRSTTLSMVDVGKRAMIASIVVPGRTRWTVFDAHREVFYVNIMEPPLIVVVEAVNPTRVARAIEVPASGPHGLDLDRKRRRLYCACDGGKLAVLDADSGKSVTQLGLEGKPDVVFYNEALEHLYVAVGDPGVVEVFDMAGMTLQEEIATEKGAHTLAFDPSRNRVWAFLPQSHRAAVFVDA